MLDVVDREGLARHQWVDRGADALDDAHLTITSSGRVPPTSYERRGPGPRLTGSGSIAGAAHPGGRRDGRAGGYPQRVGCGDHLDPLASVDPASIFDLDRCGRL